MCCDVRPCVKRIRSKITCILITKLLIEMYMLCMRLRHAGCSGGVTRPITRVTAVVNRWSSSDNTRNLNNDVLDRYRLYNHTFIVINFIRVWEYIISSFLLVIQVNFRCFSVFVCDNCCHILSFYNTLSLNVLFFTIIASLALSKP